MSDKEPIKRLPRWMKAKFPAGEKYSQVKNIVKENRLHTICTSATCPNIGECWANGTATFMILGNICTRSCKFCNVPSGKPLPVDINEPKRLANTIQLMSLKHCVITSVDRDDLNDKGAGIWAETIRQIKIINPQTTIEVLIPDFDAIPELVNIVIDAKPEVISHNLETVKRLSKLIRSRAEYDKSLKVIKQISDSGIISKSGIMLGLGETEEEIVETMDDLIAVNCKVLTMGQYLQPSKDNITVTEYIHPNQFEKYKNIGLSKGFLFVESSPLVRSSYHAEKHIS